MRSTRKLESGICNYMIAVLNFYDNGIKEFPSASSTHGYEMEIYNIFVHSVYFGAVVVMESFLNGSLKV